jgi:hypothetical protein
MPDGDPDHVGDRVQRARITVEGDTEVAGSRDLPHAGARKRQREQAQDQGGAVA